MEEYAIKGAPPEPISIKTELGWVISGNKIGSVNAPIFSIVSLHVAFEQSLNNWVKKIWKQEEIHS